MYSLLNHAARNSVNSYSSPNIIWTRKSKRMRMIGYEARRERRKVRKNVRAKTIGNILLRRYRYRWEDNIKMDLKEIGW
jgi:hypothetical protein